MKIFLDDIRDPLDCISYMHKRIGNLNPIYTETWYIVRNYENFAALVFDNTDKITHISFDHDLSDEHYDPNMYNISGKYNEMYENFKEKTGLECAKFVKELYSQRGLQLPIMFVHSMNPVGTQNIINVFK